MGSPQEMKARVFMSEYVFVVISREEFASVRKCHANLHKRKRQNFAASFHMLNPCDTMIFVVNVSSVFNLFASCCRCDVLMHCKIELKSLLIIKEEINSKTLHVQLKKTKNSWMLEIMWLPIWQQNSYWRVVRETETFV